MARLTSCNSCSSVRLQGSSEMEDRLDLDLQEQGMCHQLARIQNHTHTHKARIHTHTHTHTHTHKHTIRALTHSKMHYTCTICHKCTYVPPTHLLCLMWLLTRWPAAKADMRESSPASTAAHTIRARLVALVPGSSLCAPCTRNS